MSFAEQLKSSLDIVRVVGEDVRLKRVGATPRYVGLCPFHTEKTPSFSVHREKQFFYCFGCHEKGDVISFVMKLHGLTFLEARDMLAERAGLQAPQRSERTDPEAELRNVLHEIHSIAAQIFREHLFSAAAAEARAYVARRGLSQSMVEEFGIGLSDRSGQDLVKRLRKFKPEHLEASGLVLRRQQEGSFFDRFRGRLMFPIHNEQGKVIAFGGRAMADGDEPKYLNSPETSIYKKSAVLYNLHRARTAIRKLDRVVLVEGYMDVIAVYSAGVQHVVASCGTALTQQQVKAIRRHSEHITVNFDPDNAGATATERSLQLLLDEGMSVKVLELGEGLDPDEYVKKFGAERYLHLLDNANNYFLWLADRARRTFGATREGRIEGFQFLLPVINHISDKIERAAVANEVAEYLGIEKGVVLEQFRKSANGRRTPQPPKPSEPDIPMREREILNCLLSGREARNLLIPRLHSAAVTNFTTWPIVKVILELHQETPDFTHTHLEGRLDDPSRRILTHLMFSADMDDVRAEDLVTRLGEQLELGDLRAREAELRARIKQAEREGSLEQAFGLMKELDSLKARHGAGSE